MPRRLDYEVVFFELSLRFRKLEQVSLRIRVWRGIYVGLAYEKEFSVTCCNGTVAKCRVGTINDSRPSGVSRAEAHSNSSS